MIWKSHIQSSWQNNSFQNVIQLHLIVSISFICIWWCCHAGGRDTTKEWKWPCFLLQKRIQIILNNFISIRKWIIWIIIFPQLRFLVANCICLYSWQLSVVQLTVLVLVLEQFWVHWRKFEYWDQWIPYNCTSYYY